MKLKGKSLSIALIISISMILFAGCSNATASGMTANNTTETPKENSIINIEDETELETELEAEYTTEYTSYEYSSEDTDSEIDSGACNIILNSASASITGNGASASGSIVTIKKAGTYVISGILADGQIIVDAGGKDIVKLVLNGVTINNSSTAPIYVKNSEKTIIILNSNTVNTITDSDNYGFASGEDEPNAAIFSKDDLTITGTGTLNVTGNYYNGIGCKDTLCITGGHIFITAVNDGLRGRDAIAISGGTFTINAGNDGMKANNDTDADKGYIVIDGGSFNITAVCDGIQAETSLLINDGTFDITTGGGSAAAPVKAEDFRGWGTSTAVTESDSDSKKGLKAGSRITVNGGKFIIDSEDDAVHANADIIIDGGSFDISTGDDGMHADQTLTINKGTINISKSYEGLEGSIVIINGGDIKLTASDDGINAAGGSDGSMSGPMGKDRFSTNSSYYIEINGGAIYVNASGDGIDSNGNMYINDGTVIVNGPSDNSNTSLDCDGVIEINGGIVMAAGSSGMIETPSTSSSQPSIIVYYSSNQAAGTTITLRDSSGNILGEIATVRSCQAVIISSPELKLNNTYSLYSGETRLSDITLSSIVTSVSDSGGAVTGGFGGGGTMPDGGKGGRR